MTGTDLEHRVVAAQAGDRGAFDELVRTFQDMALALCYGRLGNRELARDAAQDAFVDAYLHLPQLAEPRAFVTWLKRVLFKHCDRRVRRPQPDREALGRHFDAEAGRPSDPERALLGEERVNWLQSAIEALPDHERIAIALYYLAEQPLAEIGGLLEIEPNTVKQRLHSARKRLREGSDARMREGLNRWRPSFDDRFSNRVKLFLSVRLGDVSAVQSLIAREPELLEASEDWRVGDWADRDLPQPTRATPLVSAAERGQLGVVRALLDAGARVDGGCGCVIRETPLWAAVVAGQIDTASELLARGADPLRPTTSGMACLHVAASRGDRTLCELLIAHGARLEQRDAQGRSAADWAHLKGHDALLPLLEADSIEPLARAQRFVTSGGEILATGIKALDLFAPITRGSFVRVRGGARVGRNVLLAEIAEIAKRRGEASSVWVLWERERWSAGELQHLLQETALARSVLVIRAPAGDDAAARALPARALAACDALIAAGQRHVQLTFFEPPGVRAAIEALIPALGVRDDGSAITTFVVQAVSDVNGVAAPFGTELAFDDELARAMLFPALDPAACASRELGESGQGNAHASCARDVGMALTTLALAPATMPEEAQHGRARRLRAYLTQPFHVAEPFSGRPGVSVELAAMLRDVRTILDGGADHIAPEALAYRGALSPE